MCFSRELRREKQTPWPEMIGLWLRVWKFLRCLLAVHRLSQNPRQEMEPKTCQLFSALPVNDLFTESLKRYDVSIRVVFCKVRCKHTMTIPWLFGGIRQSYHGTLIYHECIMWFVNGAIEMPWLFPELNTVVLPLWYCFKHGFMLVFWL